MKIETGLKQILAGEVAELLLIYANRRRRNLLVVANYDDARCKVLQERCLKTRLGGLINDDDIKHVRLNSQLVGNAVGRQDPHRHRGSTTVHRLANFELLLSLILARSFAEPSD